MPRTVALFTLLVCQQFLIGKSQSAEESAADLLSTFKVKKSDIISFVEKQAKFLEKRLELLELLDEKVEKLMKVADLPDQTKMCNVARGKPALQSSTAIIGRGFIAWGPAPASRAVDGKKSSNWNNATCQHTKYNINPWWAVDLETEVTVVSVNITNRGDCCAERLHDIRVSLTDDDPSENTPTPVSGVTCATQTGPVAAGVTLQLICTPSSVSGRYVVVQITSSTAEYLTMCEVEVFAQCD